DNDCQDVASCSGAKECSNSGSACTVDDDCTQNGVCGGSTTCGSLTGKLCDVDVQCPTLFGGTASCTGGTCSGGVRSGLPCNPNAACATYDSCVAADADGCQN